VVEHGVVASLVGPMETTLIVVAHTPLTSPIYKRCFMICEFHKIDLFTMTIIQ